MVRKKRSTRHWIGGRAGGAGGGESQHGAGLVEAALALGMVGASHGKRERVVGEDRFTGYGSVVRTCSRNAVAAALVASVVIHTTASRLKSSTAANS